MATFSINRQLDLVYNTETSFVINSALRDTAQYPSANYFKVQLPKTMGACKEVLLTHFVGVAAVPGVVVEVFVDELMSVGSYSTGGVISSAPCWLVPTASMPYVSSSFENDVAVFPKMKAPDVSTFTISCKDQFGVGIVGMPDFIMRVYVRSWW